MKSFSTAKYLFVISSLLLLLEFVFYYPILPQKIAAHFTFNGYADEWYNKANYYAFSFIVYLLTGGVLAGMAFAVNFLPRSLINIPNKDYLLNDKNKKYTLKLLSDYTFHISSITILFLLTINYFIFRLNVSGENFLPRTIFISIFIYLILIAIILIRLFKRLKHPDGLKHKTDILYN